MCAQQKKNKERKCQGTEMREKVFLFILQEKKKTELLDIGPGGMEREKKNRSLKLVACTKHGWWVLLFMGRKRERERIRG